MKSDVEKDAERHLRHWIIDPVGHREFAAANVPATMEFAGQEVPVVSVIPPSDEWVCDYCNATIELTYEHEDGSSVNVWVAVLESSALCVNCTVQNMTVTEVERLRARGRMWPSLWANSVCMCPPCKARLDQQLASRSIGDSNEEA